MTPPQLRPAPWNELHVLAGLWSALLAFLGTFALIRPIAQLLGDRPNFRDAGDVFERAALVAKHSDLALARAIADNQLPPLPTLLADQGAVQVAWTMAIVSSALFVAIALAVPRLPIRAVASTVGLDRFTAGRLWLPALSVAVVYPLVGLYGAAITAFGLPQLAPAADPSTLSPVLRDPTTLAIYGAATVIAAPLGEEALYRGLAFTGTLRWGFLPAAVFTSLLFALSHRDLGTLVPTFAAGMVIAWLYHRTGCLWDAIAFHMLFNALGVILLVARY